MSISLRWDELNIETCVSCGTEQDVDQMYGLSPPLHFVDATYVYFCDDACLLFGLEKVVRWLNENPGVTHGALAIPMGGKT